MYMHAYDLRETSEGINSKYIIMNDRGVLSKLQIVQS